MTKPACEDIGKPAGRRAWARAAVALVIGAALAAGAGGCRQPSPRTAERGTRVAVRVHGEGFYPSTVKAHAGKPVTLVLTRTTDGTCDTEVVIPGLDRREKLPLNRPV